jgi:hypothetical protein
VKYLEDKVHLLENGRFPIWKTKPVTAYDICPLYKSDLLALVLTKDTKKAPVIKVKKQVLQEILKDKVIITDYEHVGYAEKTIIEGEWVWKNIS